MEIAKENEITTSKNVFCNKNFRLVFFGALVSELGGTIYSFAVSFYILEITGNNAFLQGIFLAICGVFSLVFTPIGGVIGDRFNKGAIMFICDYLRGGLILAATVMMFLFKDTGIHIAALFITGALGSAVGGIFSPAAGALFPHILEENRLQQANSYISLKSSLLGIVGVVLAGVMYATLSIYALFLFVGHESNFLVLLVGFCFCSQGKPAGEPMCLSQGTHTATCFPDHSAVTPGLHF